DNLLCLAGAGIDNVVKAVIYLTDMNDSDIVSSIRNEYFKVSKPVSTMVEVGALKRNGAKIEIEVTAFLDK
ncbi:MAG: RidA family protein, partial [Rickettsiales bacterium]|nr:RidA family protein [Rickettsiales bacterium]